MSQDFEKSAKMVLDAEQQWRESVERANQEIKAVKFHDTSASAISDFEKLEAMNHAQNQAPLDMVAELKAINERLDVERKARISAESKAAEVEQRQEEKDRRNLKIAIISCIASVVAAIVGVLTFLNVYP